MLVAYVSGHGFGHATRLCEVLREVRARAPRLPITLVGTVPERILRRAVSEPAAYRRATVDVGLVQRDALAIDEPGTAEAVAAFEASWDARVHEEAAFLRASGARAVVADVPPLAFAAAARAGVPALGLANFSWDWIYRHLSAREPALAAAADRAARAYATADLLLELPFAGDLSAFPRRERVGLLARRPRVPRAESRRRLGLDDARPAVLVTFGGVGGGSAVPGVDAAELAADRALRYVLPAELGDDRLVALGLDYPDVVGAVDAVLTKPGYGIVTDCIGARTPLVYTDRGDFPEYPVMVAELPRLLACEHVPRGALTGDALREAVRRVLARRMPPAPETPGAARAAARILERVAGGAPSGAVADSEE